MTNILILDDEQDWINSHKEQLEQAGFDCSTTKSGQEAIDILSRDTSIKVALIDAILKDDDEQQRYQGFDVIKEIEKIRKDKNKVTFFKITSYQREGVQKEALSFDKNLLEDRDTKDDAYYNLIDQIKKNISTGLLNELKNLTKDIRLTFVGNNNDILQDFIAEIFPINNEDPFLYLIEKNLFKIKISEKELLIYVIDILSENYFNRIDFYNCISIYKKFRNNSIVIICYDNNQVNTKNKILKEIKDNIEISILEYIKEPETKSASEARKLILDKLTYIEKINKLNLSHKKHINDSKKQIQKFSKNTRDLKNNIENLIIDLYLKNYYDTDRENASPEVFNNAKEDCSKISQFLNSIHTEPRRINETVKNTIRFIVIILLLACTIKYFSFFKESIENFIKENLQSVSNDIRGAIASALVVSIDILIMIIVTIIFDFADQYSFKRYVKKVGNEALNRITLRNLQ
jgi:CheY-like chemotaxis protein